MGFWDAEKPKDQLLRDIASHKVDVRLYKDLAEFTKENALVSEAVTDSWIETHLTGATLEKIIAGPLRDTLKQSRRLDGSLENVTTTQIAFVSGSLYKVDAKTDFAELWYRGTFTAETIGVRYRSPRFEGPLGGIRGLAGLEAGRTLSLSSLLGAPHGGENETYKSTYDVEAEIRLSCRLEGNNTEIEVDQVKLEKISLRW
jgi:hypothetical protein